MPRTIAPPWLLVAVAYFSYIVIGVQSSLLGIAWTGPQSDPAVYLSETFNQPDKAVGWLLIGSTAAVFLCGSISGRLFAKRPVGPIVAGGLLFSAVSLLVMGLAPSWWIAILASWGCSLGLGLLDTAMNTWFAAHHGARLMNWLHASFGVGAAIGPFVVSASFGASQSWRSAYLVTAGLQLAAAATYFFTRHAWGHARPLDAPKPESPVHARDTLRLAAVWAGIGMFVIYTGMEMIPGQWVYSLFTKAREIPPAQAAFWVGTFFWGAFTFGRIVFGFAGERIGLRALLRTAMLGGVVGAVLLAWNPVPGLGMVPIAIYAFFTAPIWAMLMLFTQRSLGPDHAPHAIGFQVSAASIGFGVLPAIAGEWADVSGLEVLPKVLIGMAVVMVVLFERMSTRTPGST